MVMMISNNDSEYKEIKMGNYDLFFKKPYEILYNINDFLISLWFFLGSVCFLFDNWRNIGIWIFIIASAQLGIRPLIRIIHSIHLKRYVKKYNDNQSTK
ncbi:hypothetical protein GH741_04110 [Aquibacillus halophilus]|uniref:YrhK domain-containing protein n=1 Tax=Aquibacillus halophilus TaxID=930132 RepID=A0A6A8DBE5_9BACI|nr:hypothetical protein [Aquibacillus halophilus]